MRVPADALLCARGGGFALAQARLGPGRVHHAMRSIGQCELALELMCARAMSLSLDTPLARLWAWGRALRFLDGPDEVHLRTVARAELKRAKGMRGANAAHLRRWMPVETGG